ncbi:MAG: hypothetical protein BWX50_01174 [Euryarchaeota archaeon ADurb.Bin009]|nr:MAG: hypothetical protein BWX50_01174 [Euryarchaeota archaeon ADurb.Bin009]
MTSTGFVTMKRIASGEDRPMVSALPATIFAFSKARSFRSWPGRRGTPAVQMTMSEPSTSVRRVLYESLTWVPRAANESERSRQQPARKSSRPGLPTSSISLTCGISDTVRAANMPTFPVAPRIVTFAMEIAVGDVSSVDRAHQHSPLHPSSTPQPHGRRTSTVSLLPSGPEPVPAARGRRPLRGFDTSPPTSWDEASPSGHRGSCRPLWPSSDFAPRMTTVSGDR